MRTFKYIMWDLAGVASAFGMTQLFHMKDDKAIYLVLLVVFITVLFNPFED